MRCLLLLVSVVVAASHALPHRDGRALSPPQQQQRTLSPPQQQQQQQQQQQPSNVTARTRRATAAVNATNATASKLLGGRTAAEPTASLVSSACPRVDFPTDLCLPVCSPICVKYYDGPWQFSADELNTCQMDPNGPCGARMPDDGTVYQPYFDPEGVHENYHFDDEPYCFARSTATACRLAADWRTARRSPAEAFEACYGDPRGGSGAATRVLMTELTAGDAVLTVAPGGSLVASRVLVTQHKRSAAVSTVLTFVTANGSSISLTPDHAIFVDGKLAAARTVRVGSTLTDAHGRQTAITSVDATRDGIINPVTAAGTLLAADGGEPYLAASHPIWIAPHILRAGGRLPAPLFSCLSHAFPATMQAYYDAVLERIGSAVASRVLPALPMRAALPLLAVADLLNALGFVCFSCLLPLARPIFLTALPLAVLGQAMHGSGAWGVGSMLVSSMPLYGWYSVLS